MLQLAYLRKHSIEMNWRINPVRASKILKGHDDHVITCLQFCGNKIVSGSDDNTLKVWSVTTGKVYLFIFFYYLNFLNVYIKNYDVLLFIKIVFKNINWAYWWSLVFANVWKYNY